MAEEKKFFIHTGTLISGLWARFSEDGSTGPVRQVRKMPFTYSRIFDQTKIHLENFAKYYWHPQLCLRGGTSRTSLPKATDWLDNWGVKASLFHPYHKGSAGRPAHVGRIPCQLQPSSWQNNGCRQPAWTCSQTHLEPLAMGQCWAHPGSTEHGLSSGSIKT